MDLIYIFYTLIGVGFLIFVHELGHFLAAKKVGIRVETFCIGFQPQIFGRRARFFAFQRGDTEYALGMIPFGGYVKMAGEELGDERVGAADEFTSKTVGERALVLVAGAFMNLLFGFLLFILAFAVGINFTEPEVGVATVGGAAWKAGVRPGDRMVAVNGAERSDFSEVMTSVALSGLETPLTLSVERETGDGTERHDLKITPTKDGRLGMPTIGIGPPLSFEVGEVAEGSPAERAGLLRRDLILSMAVESGGRMLRLPESLSPRQEWELVTAFVRDHPDAKLHLSVERDGAATAITIPVEPREGGSSRTRILGIGVKANTVKQIQPGSKAEQYLEVDADIVSINGEPVSSVRDPWEILERCGERTTVRFTTSAGQSHEVPRDEFISWIVSEVAIGGSDAAVVGHLVEGFVADRAGILPGDVIVAANDAPIGSWREFLAFMETENDRDEAEAIQLRLRRGEEELTFSVIPAEQPLGWVGVSLRMDQFLMRSGAWEACVMGTERAVRWSWRMLLTLKALAKREVAARNLVGPIGIVDIGRQVVHHGFGKFLYILALISINLGVLNLLPFPILDGGHLLFLAIEKLKGSPVNERVQQWAFTVAFVLLISLALFVTYHDIRRIIE